MDDQYKGYLNFTEIQREFETKRKNLRERIDGLQRNLEVFVSSNFKVTENLYNFEGKSDLMNKENDRSPLRVLSSGRTYTDPRMSNLEEKKWIKIYSLLFIEFIRNNVFFERHSTKQQE